MNDTMGPEGLVPSLLFFGMLPRFPPLNTPLPRQADRMLALEIARTEMASITSQLRIATAVKAKLQPASKYLIEPGIEVYVCKE